MHVSALFEACWCCHAGFRAAVSRPNVAVPAAAAAVMAVPSLQQSASHAAVPMHQASASNQSSDSGSDSAPGSPQEAMDLQQALKIVSKHYVARNSSCLHLLACLVASHHMLTCGAYNPGLQCYTECAIIHQLAQKYSPMVICHILRLLLIDAQLD